MSNYPRRLTTSVLMTLLVAVTMSVGFASTPAQAAPVSVPLSATCAGSTGPGIPPPSGLASGRNGNHAQWYGQSGYPTLCPGERSTATVAYYNTGSFGWYGNAFLGTWGPEPGQDMVSPLGGDGTNGSVNTSWPRYNRIAVQPAPYVGPGQVAWFQFTIQAPTTPGTYRLYLRPLVEGATWMEDYGVFWYVTVLSSTGTPAPAPTPTPTPAPAPTPTPAPGGFVFPTLFVTINDNRNGFVSALVNPGATCSGTSRYPDGVTVIQLASQVVPSSGGISWSYQASPPSSNLGLHTVTCTKGSEQQSAQAKYTAN